MGFQRDLIPLAGVQGAVPPGISTLRLFPDIGQDAAVHV